MCFYSENGGREFCMDAGPIKSTVTVATGLSLAAIILMSSWTLSCAAARVTSKP